MNADVATAHDAHRQCAPDAREEVGRHGADHVVDLHRFQQFHADRADDAADRPDDDGPVVLDHVGPRGDRDQARDGAVQAGEEIGAAEDGPRAEERHERAGRGGQVGIDQHVAHGHGVQGAAQGQLRTAVESEPPEPEDEDAQGHHQHVGRRGGLDRTVLAVFAEPGPDDDQAGQGRPAARAVDDGGAREVLESHLAEPSLAPGPRADDGIDDPGEHEDEDEERPELDSFRQRARDDGRGRGYEDHLEEPVRHGGIAQRDHFGGGALRTVDQGDLVCRRAVADREGSDVAPHVDVHEIVAE